MKLIWMCLIMLFLGISASSQKLSIKDIVGRWETADGAGLEILDSARIFITYGKDRKPILSYKADFSRSPCWFDFVVTDSAHKNSTIMSLLLLENKNILKWQVFEDGDRPSHFTADKGEIVILRRKH